MLDASSCGSGSSCSGSGRRTRACSGTGAGSIADADTRLSPRLRPEVRNRIIDAIPDGWPTYIRLDTKDGAQPSIRFRLPGEWHPNGRTTVLIDPAKPDAYLASFAIKRTA